MKKRRYVVTLDAYLYARNDNEAKVLAAKFAERLRENDDNEAQVLKLEESPFASLSFRTVHEGRLTLFENKIIEK